MLYTYLKFCCDWMTRGNQREIDRERARKRNQDKNTNNKRD